MGRPVKWRHIGQLPPVVQFVPADAASNAAESNTLLVEEYEAIRLKDLEGLEQEECAQRMQVSRPTFQRVLATARQKVADSLINGRGILIGGGNYAPDACAIRCLACGFVWQESASRLDQMANPMRCPRCQSTEVICSQAYDLTPGEPGRRRHGAGEGNRYCQRGCRRLAWQNNQTQEEKTKDILENEEGQT
jgi:predicted DNA-binding protein (UPF0251 family)